MIGKTGSTSSKPKPVIQSVYTIEEDLMKGFLMSCRLTIDTKRFNFSTLSPDDYVKKRQSEGKTRQEQHQNNTPFSIDVSTFLFFSFIVAYGYQ